MLETHDPRSEGMPNRQWLSKVLSGFLYGLGFAVAFVAVLLVASKINERIESPGQTSESKPSKLWRKRFTSAAKLSVANVDSRATKFNLIVLGSVRNGGNDSWDLVRLEVRLLNGEGKVVGICRGAVNGPVRPGTERHFSVDCNGMESEPVPVHARYEVEIVDANYEMDDGA
jgi:hypothetical protein